MVDRLLGFKSAWQIGVEALGGCDSNRYGWVNRCCHYCSHLFQSKISRCWTWVVVSWSFLGLWFGGYVNFVEIFGFLGGCCWSFPGLWFLGACLWFSEYVNIVEIFRFVIIGFSGFVGFGELQWQWVYDCWLWWVEIVRLSLTHFFFFFYHRFNSITETPQ